MKENWIEVKRSNSVIYLLDTKTLIKLKLKKLIDLFLEEVSLNM